MIPICHKTLHPTDSGALDAEGQVVWVTRGTACLGSACAAWDDVDDHEGGCGLTDNSQIFPDPATTTRQTVKREES